MGIFDKAKEMLGEHRDKTDAGIEKAGDLIDERTGGQHAEHVDKGQGLAKDKLGEFLADEPDQTA